MTPHHLLVTAAELLDPLDDTSRAALIGTWCAALHLPDASPTQVLNEIWERQAAAADKFNRSVPYLQDYDLIRFSRVARKLRARPDMFPRYLTEITGRGPAAFGPPRRRHHLSGCDSTDFTGPVSHLRLGRIVATGAAADPDFRREGQPLIITTDIGRTSSLVVGIPGSGKTASISKPWARYVSKATLAGEASLAVIDAKGDDFAVPDWFDYEIDLRGDGNIGFDLYGGSPDPARAADRLTHALIPALTPDKAFFGDSQHNRLYAALTIFQTVHARYPTLRELLDMLINADGSTGRAVSQRLTPHQRQDLAWELGCIRAQTNRRDDPSQGLIERLGLLHRPHLLRLFDAPKRFSMTEINNCVRVRLALAPHDSPTASALLARLFLAQWVQVTADVNTNRGIFKGLIAEEAAGYIDNYAASATQTLRSNNAGVVLLVQRIGDIDPAFQQAVFASTGNKIIFGGLDPDDAELCSRALGDHHADEHTANRGEGHGQTSSHKPGQPRGRNEADNTTRGDSWKKVRQPRWAPADLQDLPQRHCVGTLRSSSGERDTEPILADLAHHDPLHPFDELGIGNPEGPAALVSSLHRPASRSGA